MPELVPSPSLSGRLFFSLCPIPSSPLQEPRWLHHWLLPSGEASISFGKCEEKLVLRFPLLADFLFSKKDTEIICHPAPDTPVETIRHLLLDQVIPRIVSHLGRPVLHASGSVVGGAGVLFLGQTGWGKSTLSGHFHQNGFPLLSDDAIVLEKTGDNVLGIASYAGMRLLRDSYQALHLDRDEDHYSQNVSHYSSKRRIIFPEKMAEPPSPIPIKAIFVLTDPAETPNDHSLAFSPVTGYQAAMALTRHCFHLDPTDYPLMARQLKTIAEICAAKNLAIYTLHFQRDHGLLPEIRKEIVAFVSSLTQTESRS